MPIFKILNPNASTKILIWKIEEVIEELYEGISLTLSNEQRFSSMKSELHQKAFLAVRHLFKEIGLEDSDVVYDEFGKPHLKNGEYISITHSFNFCAIIISSEDVVGIDIEKQREKILKIAHKFTPVQEYENLNKDEKIKKLTVVWGAKESLYKIYGKKQLLFKEHIYVDDFNLNEQRTTGEIRFENRSHTYFINFIVFDEFVCVYAF